MGKLRQYNITPAKGQALLNFQGRRFPDKIDIFEAEVIEKVKNTNGTGIEAGAGKDGIIQFNTKDWKDFLTETKGSQIQFDIYVQDNNNSWKQYRAIEINIANQNIDPFICYRLVYPGYENWVDLSIQQRNLESFDESSIIENQIIENSCVNCHSFQGYNPERFMLHIRSGNAAGTYLVNGDKIEKRNLKTKEMFSGAVYPAYNPVEDFIIFSSNKVVQDFYAHKEKRVEVYDACDTAFIEIDLNKRSKIKRGTHHYRYDNDQ